MTVQELIDRLNQVEDKDQMVCIVDYFNGHEAGWDEVVSVYEHTFADGEKLLVVDC